KQELEKKVSEMEVTLNEDSLSNIELNKILIPEKCLQFTTGKEHLLALTESGDVYSFGIGTKGQLGDTKIQNNFKFKKVAEAKKICTGSPGWHSALIDQNYHCFLWGWNSNSQLETINSDSVFVAEPTLLDLRDEVSNQPVKIDQVSLGAKHSILVDTDNCVYSFGWNKYTQLMFDNDEEESDVECAVKLREFDNRVLQAKCGPWSTLLRLKN
ncbi:RCC1 domain-containing 1, partial [Brachionus plicatilis]